MTTLSIQERRNSASRTLSMEGTIQVQGCCSELPIAISVFNEAIRTLADDVQRKLEAPPKQMEPAPLRKGLAVNILAVVEAINSILKENNMLADSFFSAMADAIKRVKQYIDAQAEAGNERKRTCFENRRNRLQLYSDTQKGEIERLSDR